MAQIDWSIQLAYMDGRKSVILIWQQVKHMALKSLLRLFLLKA